VGKALGERLRIPWFDSDDFFWIATDPPFTTKREKEERSRLLRETLGGLDSWILSGSAMGWGDYVKEVVDLVIYKYVDQDTRLSRLRKREMERFGDRILPLGDMHGNHEEFIAWARGYETGGPDTRSRASEAAWMSDLSCRVIRLEKALPLDEEMKILMKEMKE
jgi:hypothetical protein